MLSIGLCLYSYSIQVHMHKSRFSSPGSHLLTGRYPRYILPG